MPTDMTGADHRLRAATRTEGRLLRFDRGEWRPVGDPLPSFPHAPPRPGEPVAPWVLPRELHVRPHDVVIVGELAQQLLARCEADDPEVDELAQQTMVFHSVEESAAWLAGVEVWIGRLLSPATPWPRPAEIRSAVVRSPAGRRPRAARPTGGT